MVTWRALVPLIKVALDEPIVREYTPPLAPAV
jgi:hypothetical protein